MIDRIADFFSPEAGQRRTRWLNGVGDQIGEAARYYLGPTGIPERAGAAASVAGMFSPGADVMDATAASGDLMRARSPMEAATAAAAMAGSLGSMFIPGNAQRAGEALTRFGADESGAVPVPSWAQDRAAMFEKIDRVDDEFGSLFRFGQGDSPPATYGYWDGPNFYADTSYTPPDMQRQGIAQAIHDAAIDEARRRGGAFFSGYELSGDGRALYDGLARKGYQVRLEDLPSGESAFRVTPPRPK